MEDNDYCVCDDGKGSPSKSRGPTIVQSNGRRKSSFTTPGEVCCKYFTEFSANTSLHGIQYIGEEKRSIYEKIWWILMIALSMGFCSHLIFKLWVKWQQSPVIVSFAETSTPVWMVPFPAITVCSETKTKQSVFNFTEYYHRNLKNDNMTDDERAVYEIVSLVCENHILTKGNLTTDESGIDILTQVAPEFDEMMWQCKWKTKLGNCSHLFTPILTDEGLCFTFNMLEAEELFNKEELYDDFDYINHGKLSDGWTLDEGYPANLPLETYPLRGTGSGAKAGMTLVLKAFNYDLDYLCKGPVQGFKIVLHSPAEIPRVSQQYFRVPLSQEVLVSIKPNMMTTSEGLRSYSPHKRQCFFPSERKLKFFKVYTQANCELECLTNYTLLNCGCVSISMPRNSSTPICSAGNVVCMAKASDDLLTRGIKAGLKDNPGSDGDTEDSLMEQERNRVLGQCDCLPACTSIGYDAETSQADFNWQKLFVAYKADFQEEPDLNLARVVLFFKESQFITSRRSELYGQTDFLANCGGLLGLFLGFSILSLVEIIYFLTLRAFCNISKRVAKRKIRSESNLANMDPSEVHRLNAVDTK